MNVIRVCLCVMSLMLMAFEPACENTNIIFRSGVYETEEYKEVLLQHLGSSTPSDLTYWLSGYVRPEDKEYLIVSIHGTDFCAKAAVLVNDWGKIENIRRTGGRGYRGAELKGFRMTVVKDSGKTEFVFADIDSIGD